MNTKQAIYKELKGLYNARGLTLPRWIGSTRTQLATLLTQAKAPARAPAVLRDEKKQAPVRPQRPAQRPAQAKAQARPVRSAIYEKMEKDEKRPPALPRRPQTREQIDALRREELTANIARGRAERKDFLSELKTATTMIPQTRNKIHKTTGEKVGKTVDFKGLSIPLINPYESEESDVDRIVRESKVRLLTALQIYKRAGGREEKFNMVWHIETFSRDEQAGEFELKRSVDKISTVSTGDIDDWEEQTRQIFDTILNDYDDSDGTIIEINVNIWHYKIPDALGSNARAITSIYAKYITVSSSTKKNCLYTSLAVIKNHERQPELLAISDRGAYLRKEAGRNLKREIKGVSEGLATHEDIQKCSDYLRRDIKLYDRKFSIVKEFKTARPLARKRANKEAYEIQAIRGHCIAMVKRNDNTRLNANIYDGDEEEQKALTDLLGATPQRNERKEDVIITARKMPQVFNYKIATYDIETHRDKSSIHRPHYLGIAKYEYEFRTEEKQITRKIKSKSKKNFGKITEKKETKRTQIPVSKNEWYKLFRGFDCSKLFIDYLYENRAMYNGYTFYAHNGANFDFRLILKAIIESKFMFDISAFVENNGGIISAGVCSFDDEGNKCTIRFLDSYRLLPASLKKLCQDFKTPHQKLDGTIDHDAVTRDNCLDDPLLEPYLINDVLGLLEVMDIFGREVYDDRRLDITTCLTGASLSKKMFFTNYYNPQHYPVYTLSDTHDEFIREGYNGGRVECNHIGEIKGPVYYYDFTSLYPDVGRKMLPYGKPVDYDFSRTEKIRQFLFIKATNADGTKTVMDGETELLNGELKKQFFRQSKAIRDEYTRIANERIALLTDNNDEFKRNIRIIIYEVGEMTGVSRLDEQGEPYKPDKLPAGFFGFVEADVRTKDAKAIPVHSVKNNGRLIFPVFEQWTRLTGIFTEEINTDIYEYRFIRGMKFKKGGFLKKFFNDCFIKKATAKEQNKLALSNAYKIIANSGYGFWGLKYRGVDGIEVTKTEDHAYRMFLHNNVMINWETYGDIEINRIKKDLTVTNFNVGVASAIASYARLKLWRCMTDINTAGGKVYYSDTDSIITNINFSDHPDLMEKYIWDNVGEDLGSLKNEAMEKLTKDLRFTKEQAENIRIMEGGQVHFNGCILTGLKQYALYKNLNYEGKDYRAEIVKLKGFNQTKRKLVYADMSDIAKGKILEQHTVQWLKGKNRMLDSEDPFTIATREIKKRFKQVYTKGTILRGGDVVPLNI